MQEFQPVILRANEILSSKPYILNRDWGHWPTKRGNSKQVRVFFAREPQRAGLSGKGLMFARTMFNYTVTYQQDADVFYPYGHTETINSSNVSIPGNIR